MVGSKGNMACLRVLFACAALVAAAGAARAQIAFVGATQASSPGVTAIAFVAQQSGDGNTASRTVARPGGVVVDRLMIAQVVVKGTGFSITAPSGWTLVNQATAGTGGQAFTQAIYWKRMTAGEPANYTWSWGAVRRNAVGIVSYDNVDPNGNPIVAWTVQTAASSATITMSGLTTVAPSSWIVALAGSSRSSNHSTPAGMTERYDRNSGGGTGGVTASQSTELRATPGATGNRTSTIAAGAAANIGHLLAIQPRGSTLALAVPAGAVGDVLIASIASRPCSSASGSPCTAGVIAPAGWITIDVVNQTTGAGTGGFGNRLTIYRRVTDGTEPASYTWTFGGTPVNNGVAGGMLRFSGVDSASPIVAEAGQATPSGTAHTAPSITTTVPDTMLVSSHSANSAAFWTPPAGMTERVDAASLAVPNNLGISLEVNTEPFAPVGATGTRTASWAPPPAADTGATHMLALRPLPALTHYAISFPGGATAVTCDPHQVTITGHDSSHNPVAPPAGTVLTLRTSTNTGVWTTKDAGSGTWTPSGLNNGVATYTWPGGETSFTVRLRHNTPVSLSINLLDPSNRTEGTGSEDPSLTFADAAFRVTDAAGIATATFGTHIAGKNSDVGFGAQTRYLQAIRTDTNTGSCVALIQNQTVSVEMAAARINPTGGASQVSIRNSSGAMVPVATSAGAPPGSYTSVSLAFDAQSKAPLVFNYPDAGSIAIYARYALPAPPAGTYVSGSSNTFVVRPFGLRISGVTTSASPSPPDPAPYVAGQNFNATVTAVAWKSGDDADNDGVPDTDAQIAANAATPNFGQETPAATATLSHTLNAPSGGVAGTLGGSTTFSGFVAGASTQAVNWSEVGFINLFATTSNYLGGGQNVTNSAAGLTGVGRFRPAHFALTGASLAHRTDKSCAPASTFTYLGERFDLSFTLQARNSASAVTQNYTGAYAKLGLTTFSNYNLGARSGTTNLTPRLSGLSASGTWSNGSANPTLAALVSRASSPEPPFTAVEFGIAPTDSDGVAMNTLDFDADGDSVNERKRLDGVSGELRYGRIRLENANGSELLDLPVPMRLEYYTGASGWQVNSADTCSAVAASDFAFSFPADPKNQLAACETRAIAAGTPPAQTLTLEKPGANNQGWTDLTLNLGAAASGNTCTAIGGPGPAASTANMPYLQFKWKNPVDENPGARATFGMQPSRGPIIYRRERY